MSRHGVPTRVSLLGLFYISAPPRPVLQPAVSPGWEIIIWPIESQISWSARGFRTQTHTHTSGVSVEEEALAVLL